MRIVRFTVGGLAWSAAALLLVSTAPRTCAAAAHADANTPADVWVTTGAEAVGLVLLSWLALVALVTLVGALPGQLGRSARCLARTIAPSIVSSLMTAGLGLGAGAAVGTSSVLALTSLTPAVAVTVDHPWPDLDRAPVATEVQHARPYVVRPGDSLWEIAARHLKAHGGSPSPDAIGRAWPAWWAANREVIGRDPDLIIPGQHLDPPARE